MTLFKRVFNNHTNDARNAPAVPSQTEVLEGSWTIESDLASDMQDILAETDAGAADVDVADDIVPLVEPEPSGRGPAGGYAEPMSDLATKLAPVATPPVLAQSLAERAASAQDAIEQSQARRALAHQERPAAAATTDVQPEPSKAAPSSRVPREPLSESQEVPAALSAPRPGRSARRVRTRMLGFNGATETAPDPFAKAEPDPAAEKMIHPVGWMVVVAGPGEGHAFALYNGVSTIGRGSDQSVALDFGDTSISREKHAAVAYDDEANAFFLGHGGKSNIVRLNNRPVLSTEDLTHGDTVRIGETSLRFIALCGAEFAWGKGEHADT